MTGSLYFLGVTILLLIALAVTLPVIRDIVLEGIERRRKWKEDEIERYTEDEEFDAGPSAEQTDDDTTGRQRCSHCGEINDAGYAFCQQCAEPL